MAELKNCTWNTMELITVNTYYCENSNLEDFLKVIPLRVLKNTGKSITSKLLKVKNFNPPSPCPLPAPNRVRFLASICWERVVLLQEAVPKG